MVGWWVTDNILYAAGCPTEAAPGQLRLGPRTERKEGLSNAKNVDLRRNSTMKKTRPG